MVIVELYWAKLGSSKAPASWVVRLLVPQGKAYGEIELKTFRDFSVAKKFALALGSALQAIERVTVGETDKPSRYQDKIQCFKY